METFLAGLTLEGQPCVVIGGDREAFDKSRRLKMAGARITLIAPEVIPELASWLAQHAVTWRARGLLPDDLEPTPFLVMSSVMDPGFSRELSDRARRERFLLCCIDQPGFSSFANVAVSQLGPVTLGLASGGAVPGLLRRLRDDLSAGLGQEFQDFARYIAQVRRMATPETRRGRVAEALAGFRVELQVHLPAGWRDHWRTLPRSDPAP